MSRPRLRAATLRGHVAMLVAAALLAAAPRAGADEAADKARAKAIAANGVADYEAGRYEDALARMREADALFDAPHHDVYAARALKQLGRWLEAREAYRAAIGANADLPGFEQARALATEELAKLEPTLPAVAIVVRGAEVARVTVDGRAVERTLEGWVQVDPGARTIAVEATDGRREEKRIAIGQGAEARVAFEFAALPGEAPAEPEGPSYLAPAVAFGVGGAGLVIGVITGLASLAKVDDLDAACPVKECPPALQGDIDSANTLANVSNVGFAVGAVGVAVGVLTLVLSKGDGGDSAAAAIRPRPTGGTWRTTF